MAALHALKQGLESVLLRQNRQSRKPSAKMPPRKGKQAKKKGSSRATSTAAELMADLKEYIEGMGKPLEEGWRVELVKRTQGATAGTYDAYYFAPSGKRFRSRIEVARFLNLAEAKPVAEVVATGQATALAPPHIVPGASRVTVHALGLYDPREAYATEDDVWPVGFRAVARSPHNLRVSYELAIDDGGEGGPRFRVTCRAGVGDPVVADDEPSTAAAAASAPAVAPAGDDHGGEGGGVDGENEGDDGGDDAGSASDETASTGAGSEGEAEVRARMRTIAKRKRGGGRTRGGGVSPTAEAAAAAAKRAAAIAAAHPLMFADPCDDAVCGAADAAGWDAVAVVAAALATAAGLPGPAPEAADVRWGLLDAPVLVAIDPRIRTSRRGLRRYRGAGGGGAGGDGGDGRPKTAAERAASKAAKQAAKEARAAERAATKAARAAMTPEARAAAIKERDALVARRRAARGMESLRDWVASHATPVGRKVASLIAGGVATAADALIGARPARGPPAPGPVCVALPGRLAGTLLECHEAAERFAWFLPQNCNVLEVTLGVSDLESIWATAPSTWDEPTWAKAGRAHLPLLRPLLIALVTSSDPVVPAALLDAHTWPELLRRYLLARCHLAATLGADAKHPGAGGGAAPSDTERGRQRQRAVGWLYLGRPKLGQPGGGGQVHGAALAADAEALTAAETELDALGWLGGGDGPTAGATAAEMTAHRTRADAAAAAAKTDCDHWRVAVRKLATRGEFVRECGPYTVGGEAAAGTAKSGRAADLWAVDRRCAAGAYRAVDQLVADVHLALGNAIAATGAASRTGVAASELKKQLVGLLRRARHAKSRGITAGDWLSKLDAEDGLEEEAVAAAADALGDDSDARPPGANGHGPAPAEELRLPNAPWETGCKVCAAGSTVDADKTVLCDRCDAELHTYCLVPPLESVPLGAWLCPVCAGERAAAAPGGDDGAGISADVRSTPEAAAALALGAGGYGDLDSEQRIALLRGLLDDALIDGGAVGRGRAAPSPLHAVIDGDAKRAHELKLEVRRVGVGTKLKHIKGVKAVAGDAHADARVTEGDDNGDEAIEEDDKDGEGGEGAEGVEGVEGGDDDGEADAPGSSVKPAAAAARSQDHPGSMHTLDDAVLSYEVRREPLGVDQAGRRYWALAASHASPGEGGQLYVELCGGSSTATNPTGAQPMDVDDRPGAGGPMERASAAAAEWRQYSLDDVAAVDALIVSLDVRDDTKEGPLARAIHELMLARTAIAAARLGHAVAAAPSMSPVAPQPPGQAAVSRLRDALGALESQLQETFGPAAFEPARGAPARRAAWRRCVARASSPRELAASCLCLEQMIAVDRLVPAWRLYSSPAAAFPPPAMADQPALAYVSLRVKTLCRCVIMVPPAAENRETRSKIEGDGIGQPMTAKKAKVA